MLPSPGARARGGGAWLGGWTLHVLRKHDGSESYISEGFEMENTEKEGTGPESLLEFIKACRGLAHRNGADQHVGLQVVRVVDAMYRSAAVKKTVAVF